MSVRFDQPDRSTRLGSELETNQNGNQQTPLLIPNSLTKPTTMVRMTSAASFGKVFYISSAFLFIFTAFNRNLLSEIYDELGYHSLGNITLLVLYSVYWLAVFITPGLIKSWSYKTGIFVGSLGYLFTLLAGVITTSCAAAPYTALTRFFCQDITSIYLVNIICAAITGLTGPILWLSGNKYITGCTNATNKGKYLGIFMSFISASNVIASVLSAFVIKMLGLFQFYLVASCFGILAVFMFLMAPHVEKYTSDYPDETIAEKARKMLKLTISTRMRSILLYMFLVGFILSVYSGFEYHIIVSTVPNESKDDQTYTTAVVFIFQGLVTVLISFVAGKLADVLRRKTVLHIFNVFLAVAIAMSFIAYLNKNLVLAYIMGICWGIGYSGALALTNIVMAKDFGGSIESYGVVQLISNLATMIGFGLTIVFADHIINFLFVILAILILETISTCFYKQKEDDQHEVHSK